MPEATRRYPYHWFGKAVLEADDDGIRYAYRNLVCAFSREWKYSDLRPRPDRWEGGDTGWNGIAWTLCLFGVFGIVAMRDIQFGLRVFALPLVLAAVAFAMRLRIRKWITIYETDGTVAFTLPYRETREFVDYVLARISGPPSGDGA